MPSIAVTDVTHTVVRTQVMGQAPRKVVSATLTFGDGALTYPAGGVPLDKTKLGCPNIIESVDLVDAGSADGFIYKYDLANNKIRIYQGDNPNVAAAPAVELGAVAVAAKTIKADFYGW
jgi:hypothetical protein